MINYIFKRIGLLVVTIFFAMLVVYLIQATFGRNPFTQDGAITPPRGQNLSDLISKQLTENGFDRAPIVRFFIYFSGLFHGNLGRVYVAQLRIPGSIFEPLRWTLLITFPSFVISAIFGVTLGTISAYKKGKLVDRVINGVTTFISAIPTVVFVPLTVVFAYKYVGLPYSFINPRPEAGVGFDRTLLSLITPIFVFTITSLSGYTVITRNQMVQVLTSNQVLIARTKGLSPFEVFKKHVLRNASLPIMDTILRSFFSLLYGTVFLERFFGVPGSASAILDAQQSGEINVIMFVLLFFGTLSLGVSILVDVILTIFDPRVRLGRKSRWSVRFKMGLGSLRRWGFFPKKTLPSLKVNKIKG
ncbi:oligopeptide transport system permease protein [Mycoplasmoides fastidiosum]|uniref:Oligopeptide transport system permease protein n=1 Tax=Mycoplasmoides fastidiosum TaxID=92758 RepID=A0ABU0M024_9BACT|nr:ABC transporter permease [Mycoplasmoides fastidiosum]MDQ0514294.1 oligopeptide transport system permease protein [Mycoplasmoides fastidiosum]UUD38101.1 ABC transporter permease [Mycoplasmoides fastidiosum]